MTVKSIQTLVSDAMKQIKTITADDAFQMLENNNCNFIGCDISDKAIETSVSRVQEYLKSGKDILQAKSMAVAPAGNSTISPRGVNT